MPCLVGDGLVLWGVVSRLDLFLNNLEPKLYKHAVVEAPVSVCQVGGGHSIQRQVSAGEPSCQRRLQADGR